MEKRRDKGGEEKRKDKGGEGKRRQEKVWGKNTERREEERREWGEKEDMQYRDNLQ